MLYYNDSGIKTSTTHSTAQNTLPGNKVSVEQEIKISPELLYWITSYDTVHYQSPGIGRRIIGSQEGGSLDHRKADLEQNTLFEDITKHVITS